MHDHRHPAVAELVLLRLQRNARRQCGWQWMALLAIGVALAATVSVGAAALWLAPAAALLAFIHRQLWRHLPLNHAPDTDALRPHLGTANIITISRGGGISVLAGFAFLPLMLPAEHLDLLAWVSSILYLLICGADAADGLWARYTRTESLLGQKLDTKMDGLGVLVASVVCVHLQHLPAFYLLAGASYYGFRWGIAYRRKRGRPVRPLAERPFRRVMSGMTMGFLVICLLPLFPADLLKLAAFYFILPLLLGFAWDWMDVTGRQTGRLSARLQPFFSALSTIWPVIIRAGLVPCGILIARSLLIHWPAAAGVWIALWAMMVIGWLGRTAAVAASCLLGIAAETHGCGWTTVAAVSGSIYLILAGTGRWSLWKPEEPWINQPPIPSPSRKNCTQSRQ